jgi:hypothetical protein
LAGAVYVSVSGLERLDASLGQTLPMLDNLVSENASNAKRTLEKIDQTLDYYNSRISYAYQHYQQALADLAYAQQNETDAPSYYMAVGSAEAEYNRLTGCLNRIKAIRADFCEQNDRLQRTIAQDAETYSTICKKGSAFLGKYIEALNRSNSALS